MDDPPKETPIFNPLIPPRRGTDVWYARLTVMRRPDGRATVRRIFLTYFPYDSILPTAGVVRDHHPDPASRIKFLGKRVL